MERFVIGNWFYTKEIEAESLVDAVYDFLEDPRDIITLDPLGQQNKDCARVYGASVNKLLSSALQVCQDGLAKAQKLAQSEGVRFFAYHHDDDALVE